MTDTPSIAVAHYPEGAGHATRMLAIAEELRSAGADVEMAGGGAGTRFAALNGYDEFEPTPVDYIDTYQRGSMRRVLAESVPATVDRVNDYVEWLADRDHDALVTDDMFAAMAAIRADVPLYALKHDMPGLYSDRVERAGAAFHTGFQLTAARALFYPAVWPASDPDPANAIRVPPVALDGDHLDREPADVVVVPSHYSDLGRIADHLRRQGHDVIDVGGDDWEPVPSLLPYLRAADAVVCSGYSTVMDAAVAGTPCVVSPTTDEQEAVAEQLERLDVTGFTVAEGPLDVLDAVASPPAPPAAENGAPVVAEAVLADVRGDDGADLDARSGSDPRTAVDRPPTPRTVRTAVRPPLASGRRGFAAAAGRAYGSAAATRRRVGRACRSARTVVRDGATAGAASLRATAAACRRWAVATATLSAVVLVFSRGTLRRTGARLSHGLRTRARAVETGLNRSVGRLARLRGTAVDGASSLIGGVARLGRRLADDTRSTE